VGAILHKRFPRQVELPFYVFLGLSHRADRYIPRQSQTLVKAASGVADAIVVEIDHRRLLLALHVQLIRAYILLLLLSDVLPDHSVISPTGARGIRNIREPRKFTFTLKHGPGLTLVEGFFPQACTLRAGPHPRAIPLVGRKYRSGEAWH
jgi:hypothetical protein